jgi:hypothetical protein
MRKGRIVSQSTAFLESTDETNPRSSRLLFALRGVVLGAMIGACSAGPEYLFRGRDLHAVSLPAYLLVYPLVGLGLAWFGYRNQNAWRWLRPRDFFSDLPLPPEEAAARGDRTRRFMWTGFGAGIAVALLGTALDFPWRGPPFLAGAFISGMVMYPYFGMLLGFNMSLRPGGPKPSIRNFRFRVGTLMILVAYVGILCGLGSVASRYSRLAQQYRANALSSRTLADVFQGLLEKNQSDLKRAENARELRAGRIPDGLLPRQKTFLKGLEGNSTDQYKKYRYGIIADGEDRLAEIASQNVAEYTKRIEINRKLAEKYTRAAQQPLVAVEPDPPMQ